MLIKSFLTIFLVWPAFSWAQTQYTVRKGDTLLKIADKALGTAKGTDPRRYELVKKIQSLNPDLKNPNALEKGQTIILPNDTKLATEVKPAVEAKAPEVPAPAAPVPQTPPASQTPVVELPQASPPTTKVEPPPAPVPPPPPVAPTTPPPAPVAQPAPTVEKSHEAAHHNFIFIQPRYQMVEVSTTEVASQTKAKMKSDSSAGLDIQYGMILNHRFHLLFQAGMTQTQFKDIEGDNTPTVNHKSETLKSFALGVGYEPTSTLHLDLMLMQADHTFLLPTILPEYKLEAVAIPGAELNISWDIYSGASNIIGISAIAEYIGSLTKDEIEYKATTETLGALYWKSKFGHDKVNYKVTLTFKNGHQDTNLTKQHEDLSILGIGVYF